MAAGEGDSDWGGDAAADTTTTEELLPAGRSSNLDHSGQQPVRLQEEELHHFLLNKEEAAAAAETHVSLKESEAAAGAPGASPDEPTISVSKFPLPENNNHPGQDEKDDRSFTLALSERDSGNVVSSQSTAMEMLENINSIDDEIPSTSPAVTGEMRDLMPDLVSKSGLGVQSERTADVGPSPIERDQVETELQIGIPSHVGPSKLSTGAPVLERDSQEACDLGLEEERLLYDLSESPSCCDQGPEELRSSTEGEADVRSGVLEPVSEAKDVGRWKEETVVSLKIRIKELETQVVPPPNVTGALHIGHALTGAIEDMLVRWRRMSGYNTLWVPGVDHAGIATQVVVEKKIMKEGNKTRHDLGREQFVAEVYKWKEQSGGTICNQFRRTGMSLDWSRECFTMDAKLSKAVTEAFIRLHKDGLIYRDNRLGNWDCVLRTAISDIEVDYVDLKGRTLRRVPGYDKPVEFGAITSFAYPLESGEGEIIVATTRPETMLGDTAVAVHPEDPRYKHLHGTFVVHPFNGRKIPIICDDILVDMAFGTGAVKITPAHDPNDFEVGKRHNLEVINIFTDDGKINSNGGKAYEGMKRFDAREAVVRDLEKKGLYKGVVDNAMRLGICSRSGDVIEPMIKPQWYVNCKEMASEACNAVRDGRLQIIPSQFEDTWFRWLENIRDWCISRQLWWGHQVPAYYITLEDDLLTEMGAYNDHWVVAHDGSEAEWIAKEKFPGKKLKINQDPDVLDTWFSSGLFPFSVMGWPDETPDLREFYPTSLLETGHDILFFWVARMVMLGMKLTGKCPFKQVFLHAMVRDAHGRKMSKSLGNVIDPLEVINGVTLQELHKRIEQGNLDAREVEKAKAGQVADFPNGIAECGADALRFALVAYTAQTVNINLDILRVVGYRQWCNKLWNVIRFAMMYLGTSFEPSLTLDVASLPLSCKWILSVLNKTVDRTIKGLENFEFSESTTALHSWWLYQLCDVFIELIKPAMYGDDEELKKRTRDTLWVCLDTGLRLLHPFMPFLTEELWQRLPQKPGFVKAKSSIMVADYPTVIQEWRNEEAEAEMAVIEAIVRATRSLRMVYDLQPRIRPELYVMCKTSEMATLVRKTTSEIGTLALSSSVQMLQEHNEPPLGCAISVVNENVSVYLLLRNVVDASIEIARLQKKQDDLIGQQSALSKRMNTPGYSENVPEAVQEELQAKSSKLFAELESVVEATLNFQKLLIDH